MLDYLVQRARRDIWATPDQDFQTIFKPARITPINGVENRFPFMWTEYGLPTKNERYHVYQIGQRYPKSLGLPYIQNHWTLLSEICENENLIADIYTTNGLQFPRFQTYVWIGPDKALLIAVKRNDRIADLNFQPLFMRFYSNAYFSSDRRLTDDKIIVKGRVLADNDDRIRFQRLFEDHQALRGHVYAFINGQLVHNVTPMNAVAGDTVEFVYDSSIYRVIDLKLSDLESFESVLDNQRKFLLHYSDMLNTSIDYFDDVDFWLINKQLSETPFTGIYYHKNEIVSVRMVTHKDYSVPVRSVNAFKDDHPDLWDTYDDLTFRLHVRRSGYERPLVNTHNRIKELYKLERENVPRAMLGIDSNVSVWRAEVLENSDYVKVMQDWDGLFGSEMVANAYGYNAAAKLLADTPSRFKDDGTGVKYIDVPHGLRENSTVYEYDNNGKLLGFYIHSGQVQYFAQNANADLAEVIAGIGGDDQGTVVGKQNQQINPKYNHRFYISPVEAGMTTENWEDVTGSNKYMVTDDGIVQWDIDFNFFTPAVRNDSKHLAYRLPLTSSDGLLRFSVQAEEVWFGIRNRRVANLPSGRLDIWLNGYSLIENLDYFVEWPQVVISNKQYLNQGDEDVVVRATGFPTENMTTEETEDYGFVEHGLLSRNTRFDLRDDKIKRLVVSGRVLHRDVVEFSEDHRGAFVGDTPDGTPYSLRDIVVPIRGLEQDPFDYRQRSLDVDQEVSDYLTLKLPEPERSVPPIINQRYRIYSPLTSKVMHDLKSGLIDNRPIEGHYGDDVLWETIDHLLDLLDHEPTKIGVDQNYVSVHPHNLPYVVDLNIFQYTFLSRMIEVVLDGKIDISSHIRMVEITP